MNVGSNSLLPYVVVDFQLAQVNTDPAKIMRKAINSPVWNINFTFDVSQEEGLGVRVRVYAHEPGMSNNAQYADDQDDYFEPKLEPRYTYIYIYVYK